MRFSRFSLLLAGVIFAIPASGFDSFSEESSRISDDFDCVRERVVPPTFESDGEMFSCIGGRAETVKLFINAAPDSNEITDMKLIWNEWTKDIGDGIGTDRMLAKAWVTEVADLYAPKHKADLVTAFFGDEALSLSSDNYVIEYDYHKGPAIDQHLLALTPNAVMEEEKRRVASYASDFEHCKALVANTVNYTASVLSGDGDPVKESGYDSFMLKGQGKDLFFCELHDDGQYRIKAALGGNYPFKYIDEGRL